MRIAVVGTGMVGRTLAPALAALGHEVAVGTRDPSTTAARDDWTLDLPLRAYSEVAEGADVVVNATNGRASLDAVGSDALAGRVLLDVANPLDFRAGRVQHRRGAVTRAKRRRNHPGDIVGGSSICSAPSTRKGLRSPMPFLLRVELPDVPGSLGRVAAAIGEAGGDIEAIEIVQKNRASGTAVDDVLLETAPGVMPDSIVSACTRLDGVSVLWISRYGAGGNIFLDLEAVEALTGTPRTAIDELVDLLPITFRADWGIRLQRNGEGVAVTHRTSAAPEHLEGTVDWFPLARPAILAVPRDWESWRNTIVAAAPLGDADEMVLFGRRGGPDILDSELARLGHLAALAESIARGA